MRLLNGASAAVVTLIGLSLVVLMSGCGKASDTLARLTSSSSRNGPNSLATFAGKWSAPVGGDRYYVEILADKTVRAVLPVTMSEDKIKASPGIDYTEGNWAVMSDGTGACYVLSIQVNGLKYPVDEKWLCLRPDYTAMKLLERRQDGNVYLKRLVATATLNAQARATADTLEISAPLGQPENKLQPPEKNPKDTTLIRATLREGKLCLAPANLGGLEEQCYSRTSTRSSQTPASRQ